MTHMVNSEDMPLSDADGRLFARSVRVRLSVSPET